MALAHDADMALYGIGIALLPFTLVAALVIAVSAIRRRTGALRGLLSVLMLFPVSYCVAFVLYLFCAAMARYQLSQVLGVGLSLLGMFGFLWSYVSLARRWILASAKLEPSLVRPRDVNSES